MAKKRLLREYYELCDGGVCHDLLTEQEKKLAKEGKATFLTGVMQKCDTVNGNGRIYPRSILEKEIKNYKKIVDERRALGELDHPDDSVINLKNASHIVIDIWMDGDSVMGKIQVLGTPAGQVLKALVDAGVKLGISSRGLGSTKEKDGKTMVEDDFQLICFDFVSEASTPGAYLDISEGLEKQLNNVVTKSDRINRALNELF